MYNDIGFTVNFELALEDKGFSSLTKSTIRRLQKFTYLSFATWIETISSPDLEYVVAVIDKYVPKDAFEDEDISLNNPLTDLILLNEVLMAGDGYVSTGVEESVNTFDYFMQICICESLKRKGLVTLDYTKISYGSTHHISEVCKLLK